VEVTMGLVESNDSLPPGLWRDSLHDTYRLTAQNWDQLWNVTLGVEYGQPLPFYLRGIDKANTVSSVTGENA